MDLLLLESSCKWNHTISGFLFLSLGTMFPRFPCNGTSFLFMARPGSVVQLYHILCIYPSTEEHWVVSTFQQLCIMLLWTSMSTFLWKCMRSVLLGLYPGVKLLCRRATPFLADWAVAKLFFQRSCPISHSHQQRWGFSFPHVFTNTSFVLYFLLQLSY